jgi:hypothetical protein
MAIYLNTYETWQEFGGPEEGGWWYKCGNPVSSIRISDEDLDFLQEQRDRLIDKLDRWFYQLMPCFREELPGEKKDRLSAILDKIEEKKDQIYKTDRLAELHRQAREVNAGITGEREISVKCRETGGYSFVVSSPDDEDPIPSAYYGDQKYETNVEDEFAAPFPSKRPHYE